MKTIIAIYSPSNNGKSSIIKRISKHLDTLYPNGLVSPDESEGYDISELWNIRDKKLVLESKGDPNSALEDRIRNIMKKLAPDTIVTACRTRGETTQALKKMCNEFDCEIIWVSPYTNFNNDPKTFKALNNLKAKHLIDLILNHLIP